MEALVVVASVLVFRFFLSLMAKNLKRGPSWRWGFIVVATLGFGGTLLTLLKEHFVHTALGIFVSGFAIFYLAFVIGRISRKL